MKVYRAECDCGFEATHPVGTTRLEFLRAKRAVEAALKKHPCRRCRNCGLVYPLLVDGVLCIRCDSLLFPMTPVTTQPLKEGKKVA